MRLFLFILLSLSAAFNCYSQSKKDIRKNKVASQKVVIVTVVEGKESMMDESFERYDSEGNVLEEIDYDEGKMKSRVVAAYSKSGEKTEEQVYSADNSLKKKKTWQYDVNGNQIEESRFDGSGKLVEREQWEYNPAGERIRETVYDNEGKVIKKAVIDYDNKGLRVSRKVYDSKGVMVVEKRYIYTDR